MMLAPPRLGDDRRADQERDLDTDAGEADAGPAGLGAGSDVVIARQVAPTHAAAVVHDGERGSRWIRADLDGGCPRVERVGHDLGEDGLLGGPRIRITQVLEEVEEIDPRFTHRARAL